MDILINGNIFGILITIFSFYVGVLIQKKLNLKFLSPMITSSFIIISVLLIFNIPYESYKKGADLITFFVAPATIVLCIPLYKNIGIIKKYFFPIFLGCFFGILFSVVVTYFLCNLFGINREILLSLFPKSVTSSIGYEVSKKIGAVVELTMLFIIICGVIGYCVGEILFKIFKIENKIAKGVALGTSSHVLGTVKAVELGEIEGAISTVSITVSGIIAVVLIPILVNLI